mgnify:CR=1 FL=1
MAGKSKSPSFVLELKLNTTQKDEQALNDRFFRCFLMHNKLVRHAGKRLSALRQDREYRTLLELRCRLAGKTDAGSKHRLNETNGRLKELRLSYGLSEYQFHEWIAVQKHRHEGKIDINTAQKVATQVWKSVEDVLYRKGETVHFKRFDHFLSIEGKNNSSGIFFKDGRLRWFNLYIQPRIKHSDVYAMDALNNRVKYCRIVRRVMGIRYHYYLQLVLEGTPPEKHRYLPGGTVGIDPGVSTEAAVSERGCLLEALNLSDTGKQEKLFRRLQRKQDRSLRAANPDNYNSDGTIKKHCHKFRKSKTYRRTQNRIKTLHRKAAATLKQEQRVLASRILTELGSDIVTEKMNYKALQARAKETKTNPGTGRPYSKGRFGKSLKKNAPAQFLAILEQKLASIGKSIFYVDTAKYRASQYDHTAKDYVKKGLDDRVCYLSDGTKVQRDLYSAFLLFCMLTGETIDQSLCEEKFPDFLKMMNDVMETLKHNSSFIRYPDCMGIRNW